MPAWLQQHIADTTGIPPGLRNTTPTTCPHCKARTLRGLSADTCAFTVTVDPTPLDHQGEALAWLTDRRTYLLRRTAGRYRLHQRDRWQIGGGTRGRWVADILADHTCHQPLPGIPSVFQPTRQTFRGINEPAPF